MKTELTLSELRDANKIRAAEWMKGDERDNALFRAVELGGEVGEALDAVKKHERYLMNVKGGVYGKQSIAEELADVVICADRLAEIYGIDLGSAIRSKFNKTSERYALETRL